MLDNLIFLGVFGAVAYFCYLALKKDED